MAETRTPGKLGDAGDLLVSAIQSDSDSNLDKDLITGVEHLQAFNNDTGRQVEAAASARTPLGFLRVGGGVAEVKHSNTNDIDLSGLPITLGFRSTQDVSYAFVDLRRPLGRTLDLELRFGFDSVDRTQIAR